MYLEKCFHGAVNYDVNDEGQSNARVPIGVSIARDVVIILKDWYMLLHYSSISNAMSDCVYDLISGIAPNGFCTFEVQRWIRFAKPDAKTLRIALTFISRDLEPSMHLTVTWRTNQKQAISILQYPRINTSNDKQNPQKTHNPAFTQCVSRRWTAIETPAGVYFP